MRGLFNSARRGFPLTLSVVVLLTSALGAWATSKHPIGPPDRQAFVEFLGAWASLATVGAVVAAGLFATLSGDQVTDVRDQLSAELAAGLDRASNGPQVIRMPDLGPVIARPIEMHEPSDQPDAARRLFEEEGIQFEILPHTQTPLAVVGALADALGAEGRTVPVGDIRSVIRRTGRGNHPWLLTVESDPEHVYRVTFGGRGKRSATTERYPMPDFIRSRV